MKLAVLRGAALPGSGGEAASSSSAAEQSAVDAMPVLSPDAITPEDIENMVRIKAELLARLASEPRRFDTVSDGTGAASSCFSGASCSLYTIPPPRAAASAERVAQLREMYSRMISGHNEPYAAPQLLPVGGAGSSPISVNSPS